MTSYSSSREALMDSLTNYVSHLQAKNQTLTELSQTSASLLIMLKHDLLEGMDSLLKEREHGCKRLLKLSESDTWKDSRLTQRAEELAQGANDELSRLAKTMLALEDRAQLLADEVLKCQKECETVMKSRLETTSRALRTSIQRRKLDAVYGPAHPHQSPTFLDKQR